MRVIIAGCGIGGRAGRRPGKVQDRSRRAGTGPRLEEVGAGVQLSPNGVAVLQHLGVHEALSKVAFEPRDLLYRDWQSGQVLMRKPVDADDQGALRRALLPRAPGRPAGRADRAPGSGCCGWAAGSSTSNRTRGRSRPRSPTAPGYRATSWSAPTASTPWCAAAFSRPTSPRPPAASPGGHRRRGRRPAPGHLAQRPSLAPGPSAAPSSTTSRAAGRSTDLHRQPSGRPQGIVVGDHHRG